MHVDSTVIPGKVETQISLRIVPDQALDDVVRSLHEHLEKSFEDLRTPNTLKVLFMLTLIHERRPETRLV